MRDASIKDAVDQFRKNKNAQVVLVLQGGELLAIIRSVSIKLCMRPESSPIELLELQTVLLMLLCAERAMHIHPTV